jgi:hypothetical protein
MSPKRKTAGKKAAATRKRQAAGKKAAATRKHRAAGKKAAATRKRRAAAKKAVATRVRKKQEAVAPPATTPRVPSAVDRTEELPAPGPVAE